MNIGKKKKKMYEIQVMSELQLSELSLISYPYFHTVFTVLVGFLSFFTAMKEANKCRVRVFGE